MSGKLLDLMSQELERRTLLARAAKAGFAAAVGLTGVALNETSASAACQYWCTDWQTHRSVYCCNLGYYSNCGDFSCFSGCNHNWWVWTCCWNGGLVYCYECCDYKCSKYAYYPGVPCRAATAPPPNVTPVTG